MTVSDKDREALIEHACRVLHDAHTGRITPDSDDPTGYRAMATGLVNDGWGPRPTVAKEDLVDHVARIEAINAPVVNGAITLNAESMADALIPFLRECGIEVSDD